jgi:hypothetical protein
VGFAGEAGQAVGVVGDGIGQELDVDVAVKFGAGGAPDFAHSALAEFGGDAVVGDGGEWGHGAGFA